MNEDACQRRPSSTQEEDQEAPLLIFQDEIQTHDDPALAFFELANAPVVAYQLSCDDTDEVNTSSARQTLIRIRQNSQAQTHTGGVVWETSYLLLEYLLSQQQSQSLGHVVELGAGCGLLGLTLAAAQRAPQVTLTEVDLVLPSLQDNLRRNPPKTWVSSIRTTNCRAMRLDWTRFREDAAEAGLAAHSVDTIVGTDVVFAPALVEPLWQTIDFLAHSQTIIYLCVQIRCAVSHQLLLDQASVYGFEMQDLIRTQDEDADTTATSSGIPVWAKEMECFLFRIQRTTPKTVPESAGAAGRRHNNRHKKRQKKQKD